jgi:Domain of unknown function (DUF4136)
MMRSTILLGAVIVTAAITGCSSGGGVQVRTSVEPNANLAGLHTFYVLPAPTRSASAPLPANDPMLDNSITNRALCADLKTALQSRGYTPTSRQGADFLVAYYAGTSQKLDTTYWGPTFDPGWRYQYRGRRGWAWPYYGAPYYGSMNPWGGQQMSVTSSTQGQVIVDLTDPKTNELIWRGQGVEPVSTDPAQYSNQLQGVVNAIIAKFPQASQAVATTGQ